MSYEISSVKQLKVTIGRTILQLKNEPIEAVVDQVLTDFSYMNKTARKELKINKYVEVDIYKELKLNK